MDYIYLFKHYLEGLSEINTPSKRMNIIQSFIDNPPCFNVNRTESLFFHVFIMLVKNVIVFNGMINILPLWVTFTSMYTLRVYSHYLRGSKKPIACGFTTGKFGLLWAMLFQCAPNVTSKYGFYSSLLTIVDLSLESYDYVGFQTVLDMYIVLIAVWYVVKSLVNLELNVLIIFLVGGMYYTSLGFGWQSSPHFFIILYVALTILMVLYGIYVAEYETDEVYRLFISVVTGVSIIMISITVVVIYTDYFQAKQEPFYGLSNYVNQSYSAVMDPIKEYYNRLQDILNGVEIEGNRANEPEEHTDLIDATREALASRKARKIDKSVSLDPKLKFIIFTPDDDGPPDFETQVKYWTNETTINDVLILVMF